MVENEIRKGTEVKSTPAEAMLLSLGGRALEQGAHKELFGREGAISMITEELTLVSNILGPHRIANDKVLDRSLTRLILEKVSEQVSGVDTSLRGKMIQIGTSEVVSQTAQLTSKKNNALAVAQTGLKSAQTKRDKDLGQAEVEKDADIDAARNDIRMGKKTAGVKRKTDKEEAKRKVDAYKDELARKNDAVHEETDIFKDNFIEAKTKELQERLEIAKKNAAVIGKSTEEKVTELQGQLKAVKQESASLKVDLSIPEEEIPGAVDAYLKRQTALANETKDIQKSIREENAKAAEAKLRVEVEQRKGEQELAAALGPVEKAIKDLEVETVKATKAMTKQAEEAAAKTKAANDAKYKADLQKLKGIEDERLAAIVDEYNGRRSAINSEYAKSAEAFNRGVSTINSEFQNQMAPVNELAATVNKVKESQDPTDSLVLLQKMGQEHEAKQGSATLFNHMKKLMEEAKKAEQNILAYTDKTGEVHRGTLRTLIRKPAPTELDDVLGVVYAIVGSEVK